MDLDGLLEPLGDLPGNMAGSLVKTLADLGHMEMIWTVDLMDPN